MYENSEPEVIDEEAPHLESVKRIVLQRILILIQTWKTVIAKQASEPIIPQLWKQVQELITN